MVCLYAVGKLWHTDWDTADYYPPYRACFSPGQCLLAAPVKRVTRSHNDTCVTSLERKLRTVAMLAFINHRSRQTTVPSQHGKYTALSWSVMTCRALILNLW